MFCTFAPALREKRRFNSKAGGFLLFRWFSFLTKIPEKSPQKIWIKSKRSIIFAVRFSKKRFIVICRRSDFAGFLW
jgi:hypothetical protein